MSGYATSLNRVFKGCRPLLAAAKSATASSTATPKSPASAKTTVSTAATDSTTTKPKPKPKPKPKADASSPSSGRTLTRPTGILKVTPISPALSDFLGVPETSRADAVKKIWAYIKLHDLQNPADKREIRCDEKIKTIFDGRDKVGFLEIAKLLTRHFL